MSDRRRDVPNDAPVTPRVGAGSLAVMLKCPRRLQATLTEPGTSGGGGGSMRLWNAVVDAVRAAHESDGPFADALDATAPASLSVEERIAFATAVERYADDVADPELPLHPIAGVSQSRHVAARIGFDVTTVAPLLFDAPGRPLLRRIRVGEAAAPAEPTVADALTAVALRLRADANDTFLDVEHVGTGGGSSAVSVARADTENVRRQIDDALDSTDAVPGYWCESCSCVTDCDAVASDAATTVAGRFGARSLKAPRGTAAASADPTLGDPIRFGRGPLVLSPGRIADYDQCPRRYVLRWVLNVPVTDAPEADSDASVRGRWVHDELHDRHLDLASHDATGNVNQEIPADPWITARVDAHRGVCPREQATYLGGEQSLRWLDRSRAVLLTGRVDALWDLGDTLEIRDYKTGRRRGELADDPAALVYLLLGAAHSAASRRWDRVRVTYEHLDGDEAEIRSIESTSELVEAAFLLVDRTASAILRERRFDATPEPGVCGGCRFRAVCPHSVAEPT